MPDIFEDLDRPQQAAPGRDIYSDLDQPAPPAPETPPQVASKSGATPPQLWSFDTNKPAPSERLSNTIGFWPSLGLQVLPVTGNIIGGLDTQYYQNKGEFGNAALAGASAVIPASGKVLGAVAKKGFEAPVSRELMETAGTQFQQYRALPKTYVGADIDALATTMKGAIGGEKAMPLTHEAVDTLIKQAKTSPFVTPAMIDDFRVATSNASKKGEAGAMKARDLLFDYLGKTGDPADKLLMDAVKNYGAGKRGEIVDTILERAANRSNEGRALETQSRSLVENQARRLRGFTDAEVEALDAARKTGNVVEGAGDVLTGAKFGLGGRLSVPGAAGSIGVALAGPAGGAASVLPPAAGWALNKAGGAMRRNAIEEVSDLVRMRAPASEAAKAAWETAPVSVPAGVATRNAITGALLSQADRPDQSQYRYLLDQTVNPFIYGGM